MKVGLMDRNSFRKAVEAHDLHGMLAAFADDAVLNSPVSFTPFKGKKAIGMLFSILGVVFEDFHYTDQLEAEDGTLGLVFRTHIGDKEVQGIDLLRFNEAGLINDLTVMVRPRSAVEALMANVGTKLPKDYL